MKNFIFLRFYLFIETERLIERERERERQRQAEGEAGSCLLYTSDAADD